MQSDLPHTLYKRNKNKKGGSSNFVYNENDPAIKKQLEANKKAALRRAQQKGVYTTEQLFEQ